MNLFKRNKSQDMSNIPRHTKSVPGDKMVKDVYEDLGTVKQQMSTLEQQARDAIERLQRVTGEYEQLQTTHVELLKTAGEALQVCDVVINKSFQSVQEAIAHLSNALEGQGVKRFSPVLYSPVEEGTCRVIGYTPSDKLEPGHIARIQAPGLRMADGRIIVPALVSQSVEPSILKNTPSEEIFPANDTDKDK